MNCPTCGDDSRVLDSRPRLDGSIRRRRECLSRGMTHRFTTFEMVDAIGGRLDDEPALTAVAMILTDSALPDALRDRLRAHLASLGDLCAMVEPVTHQNHGQEAA